MILKKERDFQKNCAGAIFLITLFIFYRGVPECKAEDSVVFFNLISPANPSLPKPSKEEQPARPKTKKKSLNKEKKRKIPKSESSEAHLSKITKNPQKEILALIMTAIPTEEQKAKATAEDLKAINKWCHNNTNYIKITETSEEKQDKSVLKLIESLLHEETPEERRKRPDIALILPYGEPTGSKEVTNDLLKGVCLGVKKYQLKRRKNPPFNFTIFKDRNEVKDSIALSQKIIKDPRIIAAIGHYTSRNTTVASKEYSKTRLVVISPSSEGNEIKKNPNVLFMMHSMENIVRIAKEIFTKNDSDTKNIKISKKIHNILVCRKELINLSAPTDFYGNLKRALSKEKNDEFNFIDSRCPFDNKEDETKEEQEKDILGKIYQETEKEKINTILLLPSADKVDLCIKIAKKITTEEAKNKNNQQNEKGNIDILTNSIFFRPPILTKNKCVLLPKAECDTEKTKLNPSPGLIRSITPNWIPGDENKAPALAEVNSARTLNTQDAILALAKAFDELDEEYNKKGCNREDEWKDPPRKESVTGDQEAGKEKDEQENEESQTTGKCNGWWTNFYLSQGYEERLKNNDGPLALKLRSPKFYYNSANPEEGGDEENSTGDVIFYRRRTQDDFSKNKNFRPYVCIRCDDDGKSTSNR